MRSDQPKRRNSTNLNAAGSLPGGDSIGYAEAGRTSNAPQMQKRSASMSRVEQEEEIQRDEESPASDLTTEEHETKGGRRSAAKKGAPSSTWSDTKDEWCLGVLLSRVVTMRTNFRGRRQRVHDGRN